MLVDGLTSRARRGGDPAAAMSSRTVHITAPYPYRVAGAIVYAALPLVVVPQIFGTAATILPAAALSLVGAYQAWMVGAKLSRRTIILVGVFRRRRLLAGEVKRVVQAPDAVYLELSHQKRISVPGLSAPPLDLFASARRRQASRLATGLSVSLVLEDT